MCETCLEFPCREGCPEKREPRAVRVCDFCGDPILAGDRFLRFAEAAICEGCAEGLSARSVLLELGAAEETAEPDGPDEEEWEEWI